MPIFDQGYQHWNGELAGHTWRWLTISRHGLRNGLRNRYIRSAMILAWLPALVLVVFLCLWGMVERKSETVASFMAFLSFLQPGIITDPIHYRVDIWRLAYSYFLQYELFFGMLIILIVGPSLISLDLRFNALPLYFYAPLRRIDYFLGKLGIIVGFLALIMIVPSIIAYVFGLLFSLDITIIRDTTPILLAAILYGLIVALSAGLLVLAMSALSRNSRYVALMWFAVCLFSFITSQILQNIHEEQIRREYYSHLGPPPFARNRGTLPAEQQEAWNKWRNGRNQAELEYRQAQLNLAKDDWRPLVAYTSNLSRLKQQLLRTDETWQKFASMQPTPEIRTRLLQGIPQYPWYWSVYVLLGLFGISAWILNRSVKSLDRLK